MTKKGIVLNIAKKTSLKQTEVKKIVQLMLNYILDSLVKGETVELRNFGIFKVKSRKAKMGRNPRTGEAVPVPPKKAVTFKPGLLMKRKVV